MGGGSRGDGEQETKIVGRGKKSTKKLERRDKKPRNSRGLVKVRTPGVKKARGTPHPQTWKETEEKKSKGQAKKQGVAVRGGREDQMNINRSA